MTAAGGQALAVPKVEQHPAACERILQLQFVDAAHQREVLGRRRARLVIDAAATDVENLGMTGDRKIVNSVDHRFGLAVINGITAELIFPLPAALLSCGFPEKSSRYWTFRARRSAVPGGRTSGASHWNCGYRHFSLTRASAVLNCQSALT
jgi:hypothetical protein